MSKLNTTAPLCISFGLLFCSVILALLDNPNYLVLSLLFTLTTALFYTLNGKEADNNKPRNCFKTK